MVQQERETKGVRHMRALLAALMLALTIGIAGCQPKEEAPAADGAAAPAAEKPADGAAK